MVNPDEIPLWLAIPAGLFIYGTWAYFAIREHQERVRAGIRAAVRSTIHTDRSER